MNRIIRTVLASIGAAAVVSGGALGVAYATSSAPAQTADRSTGTGADLNQSADELTKQIEQLEKDLAEPMPSFSTPTPTPEAVDAGGAAPATATTRAVAKAAATTAAAAQTTQRGDSGEKSGDSTKKETND